MAEKNYKGIYAGRQFYVNYVKTGVSPDGKVLWQYILYSDSEKNQNGEYVNTQQYQLYINNPIELVKGDRVRIKGITSAKGKVGEYNGIFIHTIVCNVEVEKVGIDMKEQQDNLAMAREQEKTRRQLDSTPQYQYQQPQRQVSQQQNNVSNQKITQFDNVEFQVDIKDEDLPF